MRKPAPDTEYKQWLWPLSWYILGQNAGKCQAGQSVQGMASQTAQLEADPSQETSLCWLQKEPRVLLSHLLAQQLNTALEILSLGARAAG